jgi:predicted PurR-regulated permease PerM
MSQPHATSWVQRFGTFFLTGGLSALVYLILQPFFSPIIWAALLAYVSWPVYRRLRAWSGQRPNLSAFLAVLFLAVAIIMPMLWLAILVKDDLIRLYHAGVAWLRQPQPLISGIVARVPLIGVALNDWLARHVSNPEEMRRYLGRLAMSTANWSISRLGDVGRNTVKIVLSLIILFFLYRDGETVQMQVRRALRYFVGNRSDAYLNVAGKMSRVVVQSALLAALLQGFVAGIAYWILGTPTPALLSISTALASLLPVVGTSLVWGTVAASFMLSDEMWKGLGMLAWGILAVHPIDNIIRPAFISNSSQAPFVLVMFGVLGGLAAFGLIGIFLGPVILTIGSAVWTEWINGLPNHVDHMDY